MKKASRVEELYDLLCQVPVDQRPRVLIITDNEIIRCCNDNLERHEFLKSHGIITRINLNRGEILEIFSKIEFIVNEIIISFIQPKNESKYFDDVLNSIDFFTKIRFLKQWNLIDKKIVGTIICLKEVRNGFAHTWSKNDINYKGKAISRNFSEFRNDLLDVWKILIKKLPSNQKNIDDLINDALDKIREKKSQKIL